MSDVQCAKCSTQDDGDQFKRCSRCKKTVYCSVECQRADWKSHKPLCTPVGTIIRGMILACESDRKNYGLFNEVDIDPTHPIHTHGTVCPVSAKVGLPLVIYRHLQEDPFNMVQESGLDNQRATFLMIDPHSGFAPPK
ncbi:hypothetical protein DFH07DRAFT_727660 [Mycena maculata]|uniref:MYND-type domain-containing protein n=1 Tax=Mycena maculata TaxID=230809 RepID=A0AAD7KDP5_9AGAR|nr:hypothetical protein DFH07DRAFT_727660 [Mycena maculata]